MSTYQPLAIIAEIRDRIIDGWPITRTGIHVGKVRFIWWVDRSKYGEWWTVHATLHRYGGPATAVLREPS